MGILELLPPGLITFLTWVVIWISATVVILVISIAAAKYLGEFMDYILKALR